jgi:hypothetical protein
MRQALAIICRDYHGEIGEVLYGWAGLILTLDVLIYTTRL